MKTIKTNMTPTFMIIGAMKGGTTSLYHYLSSHPNICASKIKETNFFQTDKDFGRGIEWYRSLFDNPDQYKHSFEASPNYTKRRMFPDVPKRIHSYLPDVKLIYVLRDPIKRFVSHYIHNFAHGREKRLFSEVINDLTSNDNYLNTSMYYYQIEAFLEYFQKDQIIIIESEKLKQDPSGVVNKVLNFIGISEMYHSSIFDKKFHDSSIKKHWTPLERKFDKIITYPPIRKFLKKASNSFKKPLYIPKITDSEISVLKEKLSQDVHKLRMFTGIPFEEWSL
ncbi:MAG: sulfotransferase domain-containing protein [Arcobacter sp.]|nr:sulfotransferase domain-containing protein [Arcobacter sp.]